MVAVVEEQDEDSWTVDLLALLHHLKHTAVVVLVGGAPRGENSRPFVGL
jgi:hypothetical protein